MLSQPFEKPVRVWVGLGFPRQLNSVVDAYQFLTDWCGNSPEQRAAIRACKAALAGDIDAGAATATGRSSASPGSGTCLTTQTSRSDWR